MTTPPTRDQSASALRLYNTVLTRLPRNRSRIVFESMSGTQYSDSPRAIYEELVRSGLDAEPVWSVAPGARGFSPAIPTVERWSPDWYRALATATMWIDNQGLPDLLRKPDRVTYLQTWHGTPLKLMGWNNPAVASARPARQERVRKRVDRWDLITSPSPYFTETIVDAFRSRATVLDFGLPRNDRLVRPQTPIERRAAKRALGLEPDLRTVLVALTSKGSDFAQHLSADGLAAITHGSAGTQLLYRAHYADPRPEFINGHDGVVDITDAPDIADYLAVADVLVTDYSSVMFDFSITNRPIVLYQPDQHDFATKRGWYFDVTLDSPGPIAATERALIHLLATVDAWSPSWLAQRASYRARFATYEHGDAAERVVREVIAPLLQR
ncbi:MAG: CDP-glycerol glycerophosphotransferase family protein [Candidatus Nanopelagicales bacterium]|nr:CDP-glycerol glycerophosphotransferase family protein [Candidatus Nanopelagicales bacterium]